MNRCAKHAAVPVDRQCSQCAHGFCEDCLVFPFGAAKPPMCLGCALSFAGVRHKNAYVPRKERRAPRFGRKVSAVPPTLGTLELFDAAEPFV